MKSLDQWLALLERRHPVEIELGLARIARVAERLHIGAVADRTVVVAGTNGKGSCVRAIEALALANGLRVATYTSPHILRYNERVRIDGREVADADLCRAFERIDAERGDVPLTYFEVGTLAALLVMAEHPLDLAVLEVGLGGRFDAVNIIDADIAVITAIAIDHEHWLGGDRETIAREKAGIARAGKPVVCADVDPPQSLHGCLEALSCDSYFLGADFAIDASPAATSLRVAAADGGVASFEALPPLSLPAASVAAAVQVMSLLDQLPDAHRLTDVLSALSLGGRFQRLAYRGCDIVLDVAHNPAAATYLAQKLVPLAGEVSAVVALMADKDVDGFIDALTAVVDHWYAGDLAGNRRALPASALAQRLADRGIDCDQLETIEAAFERAVADAGQGATLVVCGSFFTISAILTYMGIDDGL